MKYNDASEYHLYSIQMHVRLLTISAKQLAQLVTSNLVSQTDDYLLQLCLVHFASNCIRSTLSQKQSCQ